jgi:(4-alkanoyl-5-oxo-2,5-dihydrofuran-3-yl)methyl phosphate reductase
MIVVTGASGNVGGEVVQLLHKRGERLRVLVRDPARVAALEAGVERAVADLTRPETLEAAMRGAEKLFLVVAGERGAETTRNAAQAAARAGVKHIVMLSSGTVNIPGAQIGAWHREREVAVEESGVAWTFVQPNAFMANTLRWAPTIKAQGVVYQALTTAKSAPVHEHDMAAVSVAALTTPGHEGQRYAVTGPESLTAADQVATLSRVLGRELELVEVPPARAIEGMQRGGMSAEMAAAVMQLIEVAHATGNHKISPWVETLTGRPGLTYEAWAREHAAAFR